MWDSCVDPDTRPLAGDKSLRVWVRDGFGWKRDSTALVVVARDCDVIQLVDHVVLDLNECGLGAHGYFFDSSIFAINR